MYGNPIETDYTFSYTTIEIDTWAYPVTGYSSNLQLTGAHRNNTRISLYISGTPTVKFSLWALDENAIGTYARDALYYGYYNEESPNWVGRNNLVRQWTEELDSKGLSGVAAEILLAAEEGGTLPTGIYWLRMETPSQYSNNVDVYQFALGVTSANLTVKRAPEETLVWVTDMPSGNPVQETTVSILDEDGNTIARGQTDADGLFNTPIELHENDLFIIKADGAGAYGLWTAWDAGTPQMHQDYIYTDRPIYRPGETVYFRGVLREKDDMQYSIPNQRMVNVYISAVDGTELFNEEVEITEFGTFSGELELAEDVAIGEAYISASDYWGYFTIAEFRVPEFEVSVEPQMPSIFHGDELNAVANASFFFGGGVSNAEVYWNAYGTPTSFSYTGPGRYSFYDETAYDFYQHYVGDGSGITDSDGNFIISTENTNPSSPRTMMISVEASITDESFQTISGRSTVIAHPANAYVGLRSDRYFGQEGQPMNIELVTVTPDSVPLVEQNVDLTFVEVRWERVPIEGQFGRYTWEQSEIEVETVRVTSDENGTASYSFAPPNAGIFRVQATTLDERERVNSSTLRFWVTGSRPVWWGQPTERIDLIADQDSYEVGDTAQILVPIPFAGESTVLITTERQGIMSQEVIHVEGSTLLYNLPITDEHVPTIHLSVALVKGIDDESPNPDYKLGQIALNVQPKTEILTVTATPSAEQTQPGDMLSFDLVVTDSDGNPVQAEFGVSLTDKAILSLLPSNSGTLTDAFYGYQPNYINTSISIEGLLDRLTDQVVGVDSNEDRDESERAAGVGGIATTEAAEAPMAADFADDAGFNGW